MALATLSDVLTLATARKGYCLGFVCQGWEDSRAYVSAGQRANAPVILSAGPGARSNMPISLWGQMFTTLADEARGPVVAHLDHGGSLDEVKAALDAGFTSVMFDGSTMALADNIRITNQVSDAAKAYGASVEAEVGQVGYQDDLPSAGTTIEDATVFASNTDVDALAISVGNLHLQTRGYAVIDWPRLSAIEAVTTMPLVLHGGSGINPADRVKLASMHRVRKLNVGTELRQCFGKGIRAFLDHNPQAFDRTAMVKAGVEPLEQLAASLLTKAYR